MIYGGEQYSKIRLVVCIRQLYYRVDTYVSDSKNSIPDLFPSSQIAQFADVIYCIDTDEFIKFRWENRLKVVCRDFFKHGLMPKLSLVELKNVINDSYNVEVKIWNPKKWEVLAIQE